MNDLETRLRNRHGTGDARLDTFVAAVGARIRRRRRSRRAAAVLLAPAAALLLAAPFLAMPGAAPAAATELVLARVGDAREAHYAPPGVGQLVAESDVALFARVAAVSDGSVRLAVEEVLFAPEGYTPGPVPEESRDLHSCARVLEWSEGESVLLFLWRDPETGRFEVRYGGSGKVPVPDGVLDRATLRAAVTERAIPVPLVAAAVRREGPAAIYALAEAVWSPEGGRLPTDAAPVQDELVAWLAARPDARRRPGGAVGAALRHLAPDRLRALPPDLRADLVAAAERPSNLHTAFSYLEPLAAAGIEEVRPALEAWWRRLEATGDPAGRDSTFARLAAEGLAARARFDPGTALPRLWEIHDARPLAGLFDRADALRLLLPLDPERAAAAALALARDRLAAGYGPPVDLLAAVPGPAAAAAIRAALHDPGYDPGAIGRRKDLDAAFLAPEAPRRPADFRDAILRRMATVDDGPAAVATLVDLLAATPEGLAGAGPRILAALRRADADPEETAALLRALGRARGERFLRYVSPTREEVEAGRRAALRALGG